MKTLLGWHHDPTNPSLVFDMRGGSFRDNPKLEPRAVDAREPLVALANQFSRSLLFQGGWYLLLSLTILSIAMRRHEPLMAALAGSSLLYVLPSLAVMPGSDFRYQGWMLQASLLASLVAFIIPANIHRRC